MIYCWAILLTLVGIALTISIICWWQYYNDYGDSNAYPVITLLILTVLIVVMCAAPGVIKQTPIKTEASPTIDTLVFTKNGVSDTTYVYHFDCGEKNECE